MPLLNRESRFELNIGPHVVRNIDGHKNTRPDKGRAKNQARGTTLIPAQLSPDEPLGRGTNMPPCSITGHEPVYAYFALAYPPVNRSGRSYGGMFIRPVLACSHRAKLARSSGTELLVSVRRSDHFYYRSTAPRFRSG